MASSARLDELKKKFDENPRRYFAPLANEYRKLGDLVQAIALCRTHLPNQPGHISGNIVLAQALYESRELADSRQAFEAALDLDPENLIALRYLGDIAREEGAPAVAVTWYQRVLEADPRNDEISQLLREVQAEEAAARSELASRPTPPSGLAVVEAPAPAEAAGAFDEIEEFSVDAAEDLSMPSAEELEIPSAEELSLPSAEEIATPVEAEAPTSAPLAEAAEPTIEPLDLPSFDATFEVPVPPAPAVESTLDDDPFFAPAAMGEFEAVAEPSLDDWFASEPVAEVPAAAPAADAFLPELSAASDLPAPAGELAEPEWLEEASPVARADAPAAPEFAADPESDTIEFTVDAAMPPAADDAPGLHEELVEEAPEVHEDILAEAPAIHEEVNADVPAMHEEVIADVPATEATFEPAPWAAAEASTSAADLDGAAPILGRADSLEVPEPEVEAPSYDWSAGEPASDDVTPWNAPTTEMPSAWESALAPGQLTPVSEVPVEREPNPLLGRTPRFEHAVPEEPPPAPFVTETMAELYLQQGFTEEGLAIYRQLLRQSPNDESLQRRVAALESSGESSVLDGSSDAPSVRAFFARFATRPRRSGTAPAVPNDQDGERSAFGGVASADEAMTQPDEPASLTQVFASRAVSSADAQAAATLASAFGIPSASDAANDAGELSLGHLFRDVEAHSTGAVTSAGFADSAPAAETRQAADVESHADIEQFTAWLEGLKKK